MVSLISDLLARALGISDYKVLYLIQLYASNHDLPEVVTGDLPTPIKGVVDPVKLESIERSVGGHYLRNMERVERHPESEVIKAIVKLADMLDAGFFLEEFGYGHHAQVVQRKLAHRTNEYTDTLEEELPDYCWGSALASVLDQWHRKPVYIEDLLEY